MRTRCKSAPGVSRVTALIAVHDRLPLTQRCVACLRSAVDDVIRLNIVVVDDGSTDGTGEWLAQQPDITVLRGDGSLWFGGATALGLQYLRECGEAPDFVVLLNNDSFLRRGSLARMVAEASPRTVVAIAYWTEDKRELCTTGYVWRRWHGLVDASYAPGWSRDNAAMPPVIPIDAICTTVVMVPGPLLSAAVLPDARLHPHNRYDAILSARLRQAGANFICLTTVLADHVFGPTQVRSSVRGMRLGRFWRESFADRRSISHLSGGLALAWETAPTRIEAVWAWLKRITRFFRQLAWVSFNSLRPSFAEKNEGKA